ncbi:hypothetical protein ACIRH0_03785 [Streptomyces sp. NPDC093675]|uniref:hypothetical protein n=1 Tax=Streptomyces sp. NPDC093675 TaxID=3366049 RepID=UPI0037F6B9E5
MATPSRPVTVLVVEAFDRGSLELEGGHRLWTGERTRDCSPVLSHRGRMLDVRDVAYVIEHGRSPKGRAQSSCEHRWCVAPGHQEDIAAQLDAASALLGVAP